MKLILILASLFTAAHLNASVEIPKQLIPTDNLMTETKIQLGKQLYFDGRLSKNGNISCNSCHNVFKGGDDATAVSTGVTGKKGGRNSPTVWNAAYYSVQFWDGRAATLEEQAKGPMTNPVEMAMPDHNVVVARLKQIPGYVEQFNNVFGENSVTIDNVAKAIATYERTLIAVNSPYDKFMAGKKDALGPQALRGLELVKSHGCVSCHSGNNFAGPELALGTGYYMKFPTFPGTEYDKKYDLVSDTGRHSVTKSDGDKHMWRVSTWRNIALTSPYFHNGKVKTLEEAVKVMAKTQLNKSLPANEVKDIVAFLTSLTGDFPKQTQPKLPPSPKGFTLN
ncbi:MAG: cytochrome c peroxidase [Pseudomonadota bacterium]|nr:cytochrome c peroxidase [Pseudomonadota bacterium]